MNTAGGAFVPAEISVTAPQKPFVFISESNMLRIEVSKQGFIIHFENGSTDRRTAQHSNKA